MKITKEQLNQMIQEELDSYLSEFEGNEEVTSEEDDMDAPMDDMEMADAGENEELMDSLRNLYDVLKGMFDAEEMEDEMGDEMEDMEDMEDMEEATEEEVDEEIEEDTSLNESVVIDRLKQLANIRG